MAIGIVKWFNNQKGFGFIRQDLNNQQKPESEDNNKHEDIFAHFSQIAMDGFKSLKQGQKVQFEVNAGPKGLHANNIKPMSKNNSE